MPRLSSEARAAAVWRTKPKQLAAPSYLSPDASKLWREIIDTRPPDYFKPGALTLLEQFVTTAVVQRTALAELAKASRSADSERLATAVKTVKDLAQVVGSTAVKLRLTVRAEHRIEAGILDEPGVGGRHPLIGLRPAN